jgi:hypothetical protein
MARAEKGVPYQGAKEHHILDIDDAEFSKKVVSVMGPYIPFPKPREKRQKRGNASHERTCKAA